MLVAVVAGRAAVAGLGVVVFGAACALETEAPIARSITKMVCFIRRITPDSFSWRV